jgi:hypothetical protein
LSETPLVCWIYCDKTTGQPILSPRKKIWTMTERPTMLQRLAYGASVTKAVIARPVKLVFDDSR